ncbi:hypothetical protein ACH79_26165 [Bradyrhizobium sp. CCBAU 051011]|nr:hypothetical protein ACH79_26165 [Bradyrhizobium sp. CCBAU 051011]
MKIDVRGDLAGILAISLKTKTPAAGTGVSRWGATGGPCFGAVATQSNCTTQSDCQGGGWVLYYDSSPAKPDEVGFHFEDERFIPGELFELRGQEYAHLPQDGLVPRMGSP